MPSNKIVNKKELEERVRQLLAIDTNALDVYSDLVKNVEDQRLKAKISEIARDEERHIALSREVLSLLTG